MTIPPKKYEMVRDTEQKVLDIETQYKMGFMTDQERYRNVVQEWEKTTEDVSDALPDHLVLLGRDGHVGNGDGNGSMKQIRQLAGMRGLIANTAGRTIEIGLNRVQHLGGHGEAMLVDGFI